MSVRAWLAVAGLVCWSWTQLALGATLPTGFAETRVSTGLSSPTAMAIAPDGRIFVAQQDGALRVVRNGALLSQAFLTVSVNSSGERGLLGVAFDPDFANNSFVYVYYTTSASPIHNRVSRFTASASNADVAAAGSEVQLLNLPTLSSATNHNGGAIHFGTDGKLYIAVGDNANSANSQSLTSPLGKMLRINADGTIPSDNPFFSQTTGINQAIWARGLRNPFTFSVDRTNGRIHRQRRRPGQLGGSERGRRRRQLRLAADGGQQSFRRERRDLPGAHVSERRELLCHYGRCVLSPHDDELSRRVRRSVLLRRLLRRLHPHVESHRTTRRRADFATGISSLVDIQVHPDGSLYYLARGSTGELFRVSYTAVTAPAISSHPASITRAAGQTASFSVTASGTAPLTYQWQRNGVNISGANAPATRSRQRRRDNGAMFRAVVSNTAGSATSNAATLTVPANAAPSGSITAPTAGTNYRGGQVISFTGTATDPEDGALPASAFTWRVDFHHDEHTHPHVEETSGITSGSFTIADRGETSANVFYRVYLTVRDSSGLTHVSFVDVRPLTSVIRIESNVTNAQLTLDGSPITAPFTFTGVEGVIRSIGVVSPQTSGGVSYEFANWSDGGSATHEITTPQADTTFTALFTPAAANMVYSDDFEAGARMDADRGTQHRHDAAAGHAAIRSPRHRAASRFSRAPARDHRPTA